MPVFATGLQGLFAIVQLIHFVMFCSMLLAAALAAASLISRTRLNQKTLYFPALVLTLAYLFRGWWIIVFSDSGPESLHHIIALALAAFVLSVPWLRTPSENQRPLQFSLRSLFVAMAAASAMFLWYFQVVFNIDFPMLYDLPFTAGIVLAAQVALDSTRRKELRVFKPRLAQQATSRSVLPQIGDVDAVAFLKWAEQQAEMPS